MSYKQKRHYPDLPLMRRQANSVCDAVQELIGLGIEILTIGFPKHTHFRPVIEVSNCPSVVNLKSEDIGKKSDSDEGFYIKKQAHVCGCLIIWSEAI